jgi:hypothetical protein
MPRALPGLLQQPEWPLQGECKEQQSKGISLLHAASGVDDHSWRLVTEQVTGLFIGLCHHGKQSQAVILSCSQHPVSAQGVDVVLPVNLHSDAAGVSGDACSEGVASRLAA